jgi:surfactin synthase thioesterase subunit
MVRSDRWFPYDSRVRRAQTRLRVFCFPNAGAGANIYRRWHAALPSDIEVCPVELPGRYARLKESPYRSMSALVADVEEAIRPRLDVPFALFGYSMGGLIAFELARALQLHLRRSPERLVIAARPAPDAAVLYGELYKLPQAQLIDEVARRWGELPTELLRDAEMLELSLAVLRADLELVESYHYRPAAPLSCPIDVLGGDSDRSVETADLEAWARHTTGPVTVELLRGGHFFRDEHQAEYMAAVKARLSFRSTASMQQPGPYA